MIAVKLQLMCTKSWLQVNLKCDRSSVEQSSEGPGIKPKLNRQLGKRPKTQVGIEDLHGKVPLVKWSEC